MQLKISYRIIIILLLLGIAALVLRLTFVPLLESADVMRYIETAKLFSGIETAQIYSSHILKPINPLIVAFLAKFTGDFKSAFYMQTIFFYFALILIFFLLAKEFFDEDNLAIAATSMFIFGYPMLRYGLDMYAETGALFFYVLSAYLALIFLKAASLRILLANLAVITLGFLWKEYGIVSFIIFNILLIAHPVLSKADKIRLIKIFNILFIVINLAWQAIVYFKFNYTYFDWYALSRTGAETGYTFFNITKSLFALLIAGWFFVPFGLIYKKYLSTVQKYFLMSSALPPFIALLWGWVSSRLFYVIAPAFILIAVFGIRNITDKLWLRAVIVASIVFVNVLCLILLSRV